MTGYVVIGTLGINLDAGHGPDRWSTWRPTVALCQQEDLLVSRLELLVGPHATRLATQVADDIRSVAPETEVRLHDMTWKDPWDFEGVYACLHDFARKYPFDTDRERYLVHMTTGTHVVQICTFLLAESRHVPAQLIQTAPPHRADRGHPGRYAIIDLDLSRYDRIAQRFAREQQEATEYLKAGIATRNKSFNRLIDDIEHVAIHSEAPILLTGPTGAGKSSLARRIHELKKHRHGITGQFVEVNCATLRGDATMSTLFGHQRGAFTGASQDRNGLLREAHLGLLFLDEVGELGMDEQTMLLRAIEEKAFLPLGSDHEVTSDFQLICGTNRDLGDAVRRGRFREDLLSRIDMWSFELPGIAQRREDIEPNIHFELTQVASRTGRTFRFNKEAFDRFIDFAMSPSARWSGNFRDLNAAIARMTTMAPAGRITREVVDGEIGRLQKSWGRSSGSIDSNDDILLKEVLGEQSGELDEFDRVQLAGVIRVCRVSQTLSDAGRRLFAVSRQRRKITNDADRLRKYLGRFDLDWSKVAPG